jgi:cell division protein FtsZ
MLEKSGKIYRIKHQLSDESSVSISFYRFIGGNASETDEMVEQLHALKREKGLLFGIFRFPFRFEGKKRLQIAIMQYYRMKAICDGITYFHGDGMMETLKPGTSVKEAHEIFSSMEEAAVTAMEEMICMPGEMNIDGRDIHTFMTAYKGPFFLRSFEGDSFDEPLKYIIAAPYLPPDFADGRQMIIQIGYTREVDMETFRQINLRLNDLFHKADLFKIGTYFMDEHRSSIKITLLVNGLIDPFPRPDSMKSKYFPSLALLRKWGAAIRMSIR